MSFYCKERTTLTAILACWIAMILWTATMTTTTTAAASEATMEIESVSSQRSIAATTSTSITATASSAGATADVVEGEGTVVGARAKMSNGAAGRVVAAAWQQQTDLAQLFGDNHKGTATAEDRGQSRHLQTKTVSFSGDLTQAANSTGNPETTCVFQAVSCINGCPSLFYKVAGGNGSLVTAETCDGPQNFDQYTYIWKGNGACPSFECAAFSLSSCGAGGNGARTIWKAETGAEYYVQVVGFQGATGAYTLTFTSDGPMVVSEANVCGTSHPTPPPTDVPSHVPSGAPTALPSETPTDSPTDVPDPCAGIGTSYWLYNTTTNAPIRTLVNSSATCLLHPFNIEVRPCNTQIVSNPVRVRLLDATTFGLVYKSKPQTVAPYLLYGPAPTKGDVLPSPKPLRNGNYDVTVKGAPEWGRLQFTQNCPCPDGTNKKPGKKGCMK